MTIVFWVEEWTNLALGDGGMENREEFNCSLEATSDFLWGEEGFTGAGDPPVL